MKTNAPEKIFLERVLCSNEVYDNWKSQKTISDDIEYTRTDAFIERACEWLKNFNDYHNIMRYSDCSEVPLDQLIEDFEEYLKK